MSHPFRSIAVLGPGLIGASLLKAARKFTPSVELRVWARRQEAAARLQEAGLADMAGSDVAEVVSGADLAILCMPVDVMGGVVEAFPECPSSRSLLVTDVGSVKQSVISSVAGALEKKGMEFLGSHPMAGSEKSGMDYATADLFVDASIILTPAGRKVESKASLQRLEQFWESIGGCVSTMSALDHDRVVAAVSHLPHILAASLVSSALRDEPELAAFSGGGFRDTTRVASGHAEMWSGILIENRDAVLEQMESYSEELKKWKEALGSLDRDSLRRFLSEASALRNDL